MFSKSQSPGVQVYHCMKHPSFHIIFRKRSAEAGKEKKLDYQGAIALTHYHPCSVLADTCSASTDDLWRP